MSGGAGSLPQMTFKRNVGGRNGRYIFGRDPHGFGCFNRSTTNGTGNFDDFRLGGLGNVMGAVIGGLAVGVIQSVSGLFLPIQLQNLTLFCVFILTLALKPEGLIGRRAS